MHYYKHHIGDFRSGTANMTRQERWLYRDMLDFYYDKEKPLPLEPQDVADQIGAQDTELAMIGKILRLKFNRMETGWVHERCEAELESYRANAEKAKENGKKGGRPRKNNPAGFQQVPSGLQGDSGLEPGGGPEESGSQANHKPLTINHEESPIPPTGAKAGKEKSSAIALRTYLDRCKAENAKPLPQDDPVFDYAEKVGIPLEFLRLQWHEFKDRYTLPDAKRYKAWKTVFGKSVRGNWFKLWYVAQDGSYALTTVGQQAQRNHTSEAA
jgi:uncharacterized protein YdaU (DUF1376 family)